MHEYVLVQDFVRYGRSTERTHRSIFALPFLFPPSSSLYTRAVAAVDYKMVSGMVVVVYLHVLIYDTMSQ